MNQHIFSNLRSLAFVSLALVLTSCASQPKQSSLANQIRARGEMRVDIAKNLDAGEEKIAKSQKIAKNALRLEADAAKAEKRANTLLSEAKKLQQKSTKLKQESERLSVEGTAQINQAAESYQNIKELPKIPTTINQ